MSLTLIKRESIGCFKVSSVRDCYLVDLDDDNIKKIIDYKLDQDLNDDSFISEKAQISSRI